MTVTTGRKVAVVTGGTAGVGRATVVEFAKHGYNVAILARGSAGLDGAVNDVQAAGGQAVGIPTDVADHDAVQKAAEYVEQTLGKIDVWVNAAFVGSLAFFWDTTPQEYRRMTEVTYLGQVNGTLPLSPGCGPGTAGSQAGEDQVEQTQRHGSRSCPGRRVHRSPRSKGAGRLLEPHRF